MKLILTPNNEKNIDEGFGLEGMKIFLDDRINQTSYLWYSIYRTDTFKKVWNDMYLSNVRDGQLNEIFQTCVTLFHGKYKYLNCNHYIRLTSVTGGYSSSFKDNMINRLIFEKNSRLQLDNFIDFFAKKYQVKNEIITKMVKNHFLKFPTKAYYLESLFKFFFIKLFIFIFIKIIFFKPYKLNGNIRLINFYFLLKSYTKFFK